MKNTSVLMCRGCNVNPMVEDGFCSSHCEWEYIESARRESEPVHDTDPGYDGWDSDIEQGRWDDDPSPYN